jgi:Tfp pilus assembly protein PilF
MPTTVNGIGTHYYGKSNRQVRQGVCRSCGRSARLESYDTRLWFVVVFVPVIPLGRKHIIDQCSACRRHYVADKDKYEVSRQLSTSAARSRYQQEPTPRAALELHASLMAFHERPQASEFRREALERWPDDAELHAGFAEQLEHFQEGAEAAALYRRAWELRPDLPSARVAMAYQSMRAGKLDEARRQLEFLLVRGAGRNYSLGPVETLARNYQKAGNHAEALKLMSHLVAELPAIAEDHRFRDMVRKSERASPSPESMLPSRQHPLLSLLNFKSRAYSGKQRCLILGGLLLLMVAVALIGDNEAIRRRRSLHWINEFGTPVQIAIDGGTPVTAATGMGETTIGEGKHHVAISGPIEQQLDIELNCAYLKRWFSQPEWVLDIAGAGTLCQNTITYAVAPPPAKQEFFVGKPFYQFADVDYPFITPPASMHVDNQNSRVVKTALQWIRSQPDEIFNRLSEPSPDVALAFAESWLPTQPENIELLQGYVSLADFGGAADRAEKFLQANCARRPVLVNWHRAYQGLLQSHGKQAQAIAEYDAALKAEPQNGRLLYLRGRIDADYDTRNRYYVQSETAEPDLPWPWYATAAETASQGNWAECLRNVDQATERKLDPLMVRGLRHVARMGVGDFGRLEQEYRAELAKQPLDASTLIKLCDVLAAEGQAEQARQALREFEQRTAALNYPNIAAAIKGLRMAILYTIGDFAALSADLADTAIPTPPVYQAQTLLCTGQPDAAAKADALAKQWDDPWNAMLLSVAFARNKQADEAKHWSSKAIEAFRRKGPDEAAAADCFEAATLPSMTVLSHLQLMPEQKAILLAAMIQRFPESGPALKPLVAKLNVSRLPPYQLIQQVVAEPVKTAAGR